MINTDTMSVGHRPPVAGIGVGAHVLTSWFI